MESQHVSSIAQLETICFADPWDEKSIDYELTNQLSHWLVALEADTVVGYVGSQTVIDETDMMNIAVHPDFRRKGIAEALVNALVSDLKELGSHCLTLEVRESNEPAKALYEKLGFIHVGTRKNYYRHPKEDGLILRKEWTI